MMSADDDEILSEQERLEAEDTTVYMYFLRYKGAFYQAECVEVTPDTAYFQVDPSLVRKGLFAKNRLDLRWFEDMQIELVFVHHPPLMEQ